jgi:signal recognition particle subunit SEC65
MGYNLHLEKIFNKIPKDKIELKRIELSIVDDFKKQIRIFKEYNKETNKLISEVNKSTKTHDKSFKAINKQKDVLEKAQQKAAEEEENANDLLQEIVDAADALGVNYQAVQGYGELDKVYDKLGDLIFEADEELGNIKRA